MDASVDGGHDAGELAPCDIGDVRCGSECVDPSSDPRHCGVCTNACGPPRPLCRAGECVAACPAGEARCALGCVDTDVDPGHCGACDHACPAPDGAVASCAGGVCGFTCAADRGDCDTDPANGCEVDLTGALHHCGACGNDCAALAWQNVGETACEGGSCVIAACLAGTLDCDGARGDGCEEEIGPAACSHYGWDHTFGSDSSDGMTDVAVDAAGNVFATGTFGGSVDFGGGSRARRGYRSAFVVSFASDGTYRWDRTFGGSGETHGVALAVAPDGGVLASGWFRGSTDFGGGERTSAGDGVFLVALNAAGAYEWDRAIDSTSNDMSGDVAVGSDGTIAVTGFVLGEVDFGGGARAASGSVDAFVASYARDGTYRWDWTVRGPGEQHGNGVGVDAEGGVAVVGISTGPVDYGGGTRGAGAFVVRLGPAGDYRWDDGLFELGSESRDIAMGADAGIVVTGDRGPFYGDRQVFVRSLDASGALRWERTFGGEPGDYGTGVTLDDLGNLVVTGTCFGSIDFGGGAAVVRSSAAYAVSYHADGTYRWDRVMPATVSTAWTQGASVAVDGAGRTLLAGHYIVSADFGDGARTSAGDSDGFLVSLGCGCAAD